METKITSCPEISDSSKQLTMDAKQFYNGFICSPEIQTKYEGEDKRELLFELMEKYADYKTKEL